MSFSEALKGAIRGFVYSLGHELAHFSLPYLHQTSVINHLTFSQNVGIMGLL
jgi:hypothetical protein